MKFIDLLDDYLVARDNLLTFNQAKFIPSKEYQEAGQHLYQTAQAKRDVLDKALSQVEDMLKYLSDESVGE
jgi:hypothetical protein